MERDRIGIDRASGFTYRIAEEGKILGEQTPIALCSRCQKRYTGDPNKDVYGQNLLDHEQPEGPREPVCDLCFNKEIEAALDAQTLALLERKLGLNEGNYAALNAVLRLVEDPDKLVQIMQVHNRVDELERRLEDRTNSLRSEFGNRTLIYGISLSVALTLLGFLAGFCLQLLL